jgi:hypothetical protein
MFCPTCEAEYEPGITHCADDGAELVDQLSVAAGAHDNSDARFVPLHTLSSPAEAEMVNDILQQNGIRSVVQSGASDQFSPLFSVMSPGAQVLVDERDLDRARELYESFFGDDTSPLTGPSSEEDLDETESE